MYGEVPWFVAYTGRRLRREFPAVKPWEWIEHPDWHGRAITTLRAESEGDALYAENKKNGAL